MKLVKKIKVLNRKNTLHSWIGILNVAKSSILPMLIYKLDSIPIKIPARIFVDTGNIFLKFI